VRPDCIIFYPPSLNKQLGLKKSIKNLPIQEFISKFSVKTFYVSIFPRTSWLNVTGFYTYMSQPLSTAFAVNSDPLSERIFSGTPLITNSSAKIARTSSTKS
jgi:hypothetical protein